MPVIWPEFCPRMDSRWVSGRVFTFPWHFVLWMGYLWGRSDYELNVDSECVACLPVWEGVCDCAAKGCPSFNMPIMLRVACVCLCVCERICAGVCVYLFVCTYPCTRVCHLARPLFYGTYPPLCTSQIEGMERVVQQGAHEQESWPLLHFPSPRAGRGGCWHSWPCLGTP